MKSRFTIAHAIALLALLMVVAAGGLVIRWVLAQPTPGASPATAPDAIVERLDNILSPRLIEMLGSRLGDQPRAPRPDAIESLWSGSEIAPPAEEKLAGLSAQSRETLRLRYNLGLLKFHQNDTAGALAAFASVLEVDPQGAYGMRAFQQIGILHAMQGDFARAAENFAKAVALDPNDPLAAHNHGIALMKLGRMDDAIRLLSRAATLDGSNVGILQNLGNAHLAAGHAPAAAQAYGQALSLEPTNAQVRFNLGLARLKTEDLAAAEDEFRRATEGLEGPQGARAAAFLGLVRYQRGFFGEAAKAFGLAAARAPENVDYRFNEAVALARSGLPSDAIRSFRGVVQKAPADAPAWFGLGSSLYLNGERKEALSAYAKGLEIDTTATSPLFTVGYILLEQGDPAAAAERFRRIIEIGGPDVPRAHVNLGLCYEALGRPEDAAKEYEAGDPSDARTFYNLGLVRRRLGNVSGAVEAFQKAVEMKPDEAKYAAALGDAYFEADMPAAAAASYEKAVRAGGEDFELLIRLAQLAARLEKSSESADYVRRARAAAVTGAEKARVFLAEGLWHDRRGDLAAALNSFRTAAAFDDANPDVYYNLGVLEARLRSYDRAVDALRVAIRLNPNYAAAHTQLGNVFAARGLREEAAREYERAVQIDSSAVEAAFNLREMNARR